MPRGQRHRCAPPSGHHRKFLGYPAPRARPLADTVAVTSPVSTVAVWRSADAGSASLVTTRHVIAITSAIANMITALTISPIRRISTPKLHEKQCQWSWPCGSSDVPVGNL
jgi:hypothetical protein